MTSSVEAKLKSVRQCVKVDDVYFSETNRIERFIFAKHNFTNYLQRIVFNNNELAEIVFVTNGTLVAGR